MAGAIVGDTVSLASSGSLYDSATVAGASSLTVSGISVASVAGTNGSVASDYVVSAPTLTTAAAITKAPLAVTASNATKIYGGVNPAFTYGVTGFVGGENLASSGVTGSASVSTTATETTGVGSVAITPTIGTLAAANYSFNFINGALSITPRPLSFTATKIYDATTTLSGSLLTPSNLVTPCSSNCVISGNATLAAKNVGSQNITVFPSALPATSYWANYTLTGASGTATVTPAALSVAYTGVSRVYDGSVNATVTGVASPLLNDVVTVSVGNASFSNKNVGNAKTISFTGVTLTGTDAANYTVASSGITVANITPLALSVTYAGADRVYDGGTAATVIATPSNLVAGDRVTLTVAGGSFASKNVAYDSSNNVISKTVSFTGTTLGGNDSSNYSFSSVAGTTTAVITPKPLTVTGISAANKVYDGGISAVTGYAGLASGLSAGGLVGGDIVTVAATGVFDNKNAGLGKTVTLSSTYGGADRGNYVITDQPTASADITPLTLSMTYTGVNRVYDGTAGAVVTATATNKVSGDNLLVNVGTAAFREAVSAPVGSRGKDVGALKAVDYSGVTLSGSDAGNYTLAATSGATTATITAKTLTISGITASNKVYDGGTAATVSTTGVTTAVLQAGGLVANDVVTVSATGVFNDKTAAIGKTVTLTSTYGGADAGNYSFVHQATTTADVTPKPVTVSGLTWGDKVYDGLLSAGAVTTTGVTSASTIVLVTGIVASDSVNVTATGNYADKNVAYSGASYATKTITVSGITLAGTDGANYTVNLAGSQQTYTAAKITPKALTLNGASGVTKTYDGTTDLPAGVSGFGSFTGIVGNDVVSTTGRGVLSGADVGSRAVNQGTLLLTGADAGNYSIGSYVAGSATVNPLALTFTATKVYDATTSLQGSALVPTNLVNACQSDCTFGGIASIAEKDVGSHAITITGASLPTGSSSYWANYTLTGASGSATVTPKALTVTADAKTKVYGDANPALTATISGYAGSETLLTSGVTGLAALSTTASTTTSVGGSTISAAIGSLAASNYSFTFSSGTLTVTPRPLIFTATRVYDATNNLQGSLLNPTNLVTPCATDCVFGGTATIALKDVGARAISVSGATIPSVNASYWANYTLSGASGVATITAAPLSVTFSAASRDYNGTTNASVNASASPLLSDIVSVSVPLANFSDKNVANGKTVSLAELR